MNRTPPPLQSSGSRPRAGLARARLSLARLSLARLSLARLSLVGLSLAGLAGCATSGPRPSDSGLTDTVLQQRSKALETLAVTALRPCAGTLAADDHGVLVVLGKPDGSIDLGPLQWLGSATSQKCLTDEAVKARLPPYGGPTVTWLWSVGSTAHPAPGPLSPPAGYPERLAEQTRLLQGQSSAGLAAPHSPLAACPLRSPHPDAFASVVARLFVFPDGRVAGATPIAAAYEAKEPVFIDCAMDLVRAWQFPPFTGPGFIVVDAPLKRGIDPRVR